MGQSSSNDETFFVPSNSYIYIRHKSLCQHGSRTTNTTTTDNNQFLIVFDDLLSFVEIMPMPIS